MNTRIETHWKVAFALVLGILLSRVQTASAQQPEPRRKWWFENGTAVGRPEEGVIVWGKFRVKDGKIDKQAIINEVLRERLYVVVPLSGNVQIQQKSTQPKGFARVGQQVIPGPGEGMRTFIFEFTTRGTEDYKRGHYTSADWEVIITIPNVPQQRFTVATWVVTLRAHPGKPESPPVKIQIGTPGPMPAQFPLEGEATGTGYVALKDVKVVALPAGSPLSGRNVSSNFRMKMAFPWTVTLRAPRPGTPAGPGGVPPAQAGQKSFYKLVAYTHSGAWNVGPADLAGFPHLETWAREFDTGLSAARITRKVNGMSFTMQNPLLVSHRIDQAYEVARYQLEFKVRYENPRRTRPIPTGSVESKKGNAKTLELDPAFPF